MDDQKNDFADETTDMALDSAVSASTELRKRRSTRIVQAVPVHVTGVDALGRPFTEHTSSLIINCHGCRYQSKHYVLKNMWVSLEIPHSEAGQPPRTVRGRVAWIQRPRTVRQLFQVALELELPGNVWGIAFPPEDWFGFTLTANASSEANPSAESPNTSTPSQSVEFNVPLNDPDHSVPPSPDNLRLFPSPASTTDASLQLARHVSRLVADAKQQIHAAAREAASSAVSAERRVSFEQWEQKFAAARAEIVNEASRAIERIQKEVDEQTRTSHAAAAEALRTELPRWLAPQLEQLARDLAAQLSSDGAAQRNEHAQQLATSSESIRSLCQQADETAARLKSQSEQAESQAAAQLATHANETSRAAEEISRQRESFSATVAELQQKALADLSAAQSSWQERLAIELETAQARWQATIESVLASARETATGGLDSHASNLQAQLQEESQCHTAALRDAAAATLAETQQHLTALKQAAEAQSKILESNLARATESSEHLEHFSARLDTVQNQALNSFQSQLDDVLSVHRNELHRRSEALFEEINSRVRAVFEDATRTAIVQFDTQIENMVQPHISRTEDAIHRLVGGRSLFDAAMTLQQDRIRASADEAFAESLAGFRENLGGVESILNESAQTITTRNLAELEERLSGLKHQSIEDLLKSAEWYEKKAQTQMQHAAEKAVEGATSQFHEKAGEVSSLFASELDNTSRNFVGHTHHQMEEAVRDAFERSRALFAEVSETTTAAFTDEIQRTARLELNGFSEEVQRAVAESQSQLDSMRIDAAQKVTAEQEAFLHRFRDAVGGVIEGGVTDAQQKVEQSFGPLIEKWKSLTDAHQASLQSVYQQMDAHAAEEHAKHLENISNQWMLATVASLDHQSREALSGLSKSAEEQLRETCTHVFENIGETLRERLQEIAQSFASSIENPKSRSANSGA